jgi:hypothetical protein
VPVLQYPSSADIDPCRRLGIHAPAYTEGRGRTEQSKI